MKIFHCDHCQQVVFYENTTCVNCGHVLAYLPDILDIAALEPNDDTTWRSLAPESGDTLYRLCQNYEVQTVCNWAMPADDPHQLCRSCRLTRVVPNLESPGNLESWRRLETAKRRLIHTLLDLQLPLVGRDEDAEHGLAYDFLSDDANADSGPVLTGHEDGVITINVAEADDVEREKRRLSLHEPYRTLLGHFRHEVGHYYWDVLMRDPKLLELFREQFGDEREDYATALKQHYEQGPRADWSLSFVSAYASSHPWEDWAETWAHYLHMIDALDTAAACGIGLNPGRNDEPSLAPIEPGPIWARSFDELIDDWLALTYALNNLNRSLGLADGYPFVLATSSIEKLRHIHQTLILHRDSTQAAPA